nr:hypothetical protein [Haemophilus influenzae]
MACPRRATYSKLVANMLVKAGVDRILTLDLHAVSGSRFL